MDQIDMRVKLLSHLHVETLCGGCLAQGSVQCAFQAHTIPPDRLQDSCRQACDWPTSRVCTMHIIKPALANADQPQKEQDASCCKTSRVCCYSPARGSAAAAGISRTVSMSYDADDRSPFPLNGRTHGLHNFCHSPAYLWTNAISRNKSHSLPTCIPWTWHIGHQPPCLHSQTGHFLDILSSRQYISM